MDCFQISAVRQTLTVSASGACSPKGSSVEGDSYKRHRFPAEVIRHAVWLYFRFMISFRNVEDLLAERGIDVSFEMIRCWTIKFGPAFASYLKRRRALPTGDGLWMR